MILREQHVPANDVRVPPVSEGDVIVVDRYRLDQPKAVILHPRDYALLRDSALVVGSIEPPVSLSDAAIAAREAEDRPRDDLVIEDSDEIAKLLAL